MHLLPVYNRPEVVFDSGEGAFVFDKEGTAYLDFSSGVAVTVLGHNHPRLVEALTSQAGKIWHLSNLFRIQEQERLGRRLTENTFSDLVFFTNSGAEAWECGIKIIRRYHQVKGSKERYRVITLEGCFHGRTLGAISSSTQPKMVQGFDPLLDGFDCVPWNDIEALEKAITPQTAAICLEPIQGEGGIRVCSDEYLRQARRIADDHGLILFFDEIQCGMGRTGRLFRYEEVGVGPDAMCIAKGLGGGFPIGACLVTQEIGAVMTYGTHGSTFGGNPLAMAVGNAILDCVLSAGFLERSRQVSEYLFEGLKRLSGDYPEVFLEVRGVGLLLGLRCGPPIEAVIQALLSYRMLTVPAGGNVVRLLPPLIIGQAEVDIALERLERVAKDFS